MIIYKRKGSLYYRLEPEATTFTEAFISNSQCRLFISIQPEIYQDTISRIDQMGFDESTAEEFNSALAAIKSAITPA
jgi:hypothetical protein